MAGASNPFGDEDETGVDNPFDEEESGGANPFGDDDDERGNPFDSPHESTPKTTNNRKTVSSRPKKAAAPPPPSLSSSSTPLTLKTTDSVTQPVTASVTPKIRPKTSTVNIVKSLIPVEESTAQHHELFLQEIEAVDEYWGPTFRGVYESGQHEMFLERLEDRIKKHDKDIEKMCSHHYQGFIESVRDLLRVRSQATQLKQEVVTIDKEMRVSCRKVLSGSEQLVRARNTETNIAATIESLSDNRTEVRR